MSCPQGPPASLWLRSPRVDLEGLCAEGEPTGRCGDSLDAAPGSSQTTSAHGDQGPCKVLARDPTGPLEGGRLESRSPGPSPVGDLPPNSLPSMIRSNSSTPKAPQTQTWVFTNLLKQNKTKQNPCLDPAWQMRFACLLTRQCWPRPRAAPPHPGGGMAMASRGPTGRTGVWG